ncbi:MAG: cache domain-containing protein, partial [Granulosicoccaceae bacterium]
MLDSRAKCGGWRYSVSTANISWFRVAVGLVAALGTVGYMLYDWQFDRERTRLQNLLSAQASELDRQLENLDVVPRVLASDPRLLKVFGSVDTQHVRQANQLLRVIVQQTQISDAFLMDSTGLTIAASNFEQDNSFVGENYSFRPYFKGAMEGELSSQYAVGYTTGVPGFFIAHPMLDGAQILGVVAVKLSLAHLPDSWREQAHQSLLLDSVGIVIQSTDKSMLYAHSRQLSAQETERVVLANNYPVAPPVKLFLDLQKFRASYGNQTFVAAGQSLENQAWQLVMLSTQRSVLWRTATIGFVLLALAALLFFLARSYRYQRLLAFAEQDNARKLENLVQQRTQALEKAQQALIVESNFAVLGRMSAAINHEVNQPLTSLRFNLASLRKMLGRESLNMDEVQQTVVDCDRTTKRISRVVE